VGTSHLLLRIYVRISPHVLLKAASTNMHRTPNFGFLYRAAGKEFPRLSTFDTRVFLPRAVGQSGRFLNNNLHVRLYGRRFRLLKTSRWGELARVSVRLARADPWDEAQATAFVLCGDRYSTDGRSISPYPQQRASELEHSQTRGQAAHPHSETKIMLTVASWIPTEVVSKLYLNEQRGVNGGRKQGRPSLRNIEVFRFVLQHTNPRTVNRDEHLEKLSLSKSWRELRELRDKRWPFGHGWRYGDKGVQSFHRDFGLGQLVKCTDA